MMNGWLVAKLSSNDYLLLLESLYTYIFNDLHPTLHIE